MGFIELMQKIPEDVIIQHICPFLYQPKSQEFCNDIKSFVYTKNYLYQLYFSKYSLREYNRQLLLADISRFINGYNSYYFRYSNLFYAKMKKLFMLRDKKLEYVHKFIRMLEHKLPIEIGIHIKIGILTPKERSSLIEFVKYIQSIP
jgi:hypothetical protein